MNQFAMQAIPAVQPVEPLQTASSPPAVEYSLSAGFQVIELDKRCCLDRLRIDGPVNALFDVAIIPDVSCPMTVSSNLSEAASLVTFDKEATAVAQPFQPSGLSVCIVKEKTL